MKAPYRMGPWREGPILSFKVPFVKIGVADWTLPCSDASLAPSVTLLAPHFKSIFQLAVAYIGVLHKKIIK